MHQRTAAVVLAAAPSDEFATPVQLAPYRGRPLLEYVLDQVRAWPVDAIYVVLGSDAEEILESVDLEGCTVVIDLEWEEGRASALRAAVDTVLRADAAEALVLVEGTVPDVDPEIVGRLLEAHGSSGKPAVIPKYRYQRGDPIVLGAEVWPRLLGMEGDSGPEQLIGTHPELVEEVWFDRLAPRRVQRPIDLEDARRSPSGGG